MALSTRSDVIALDSSQASLLVSEVKLTQYFQIAIATFLVYNAITTLDKEVKYFWGARLNVVTLVFFANRYIGIFGAFSDLAWNTYEANSTKCNFSQWSNNVANYITIISIDYILMIRVLALYSQPRRLAYVLKAFLGLEAIVKLIIMIYATKSNDVLVGSLGPGGPTICGEESESSAQLLISLGIVDWTIPMVYAIILMALALYKASEFWRMSSGFKGFNLVKVVIIDQALYFTMAVACCVFNIMAFELSFSNYFLATLIESLGRPSFLCALGSSMLFNLKEAGEQGLNQGTSYRVTSVSAMMFAEK